jgi:hypothetical protein
MQGVITVQNADETALTAHKETIAKTLTSHVQSSSLNSKSEVRFEAIKRLDNGDLEMTYTCSGVKDHSSAQYSLKQASQSDAIKETIGKCSHSASDDSKATEKPTEAGKQKVETQNNDFLNVINI